MIKAIREAFDDFVIAARIKPAITAGIPLLFMVFFNGVVKCKWMEAGIGLALIAADPEGNNEAVKAKVKALTDKYPLYA